MLNVSVVLSDDTRLDFDDENIVANSVSVEMSTCHANSFDFGTFNGAILKIGLVVPDAAGTDFSGALIQLEEETEEDGDTVITALGEYIVDGTQTKRERNAVYLVAQDHTVDFDKDIPDNARETSYTALTAIQAACTACGLSLEGSLPVDAPNTSVTFTLASTAVQTWRDVVMWACQLTACNAVINREGLLEIRKAYYEYNADPDFTATASDRKDIKFSDTRVYIKYMTAYSGNKTKTYTSQLTPPSQSKPGIFTLSKNPLLSEKTEAECDTINDTLLTKPFTQRKIEAKLFENPGISLGKIGVYSGGKVDVRNSIRGMTTGITWKYHGYTRVVCSAPDTIEE